MIEEVTQNDNTPSQEKLESSELKRIPLDKIIIDKNIRSFYDDKSIQELAESLRDHGLLQPIRVFEQSDGQYAILLGHRRYLAAKSEGWIAIDCLVQKKCVDDIERTIIQLIENRQRENINPSDYETAILRLENEYRFGSEEICKRFNRSAGWYSQIKGAHEFREKFGHLFIEAGIPLCTKDAYELRNAGEFQVKQLILKCQNEDGTLKSIRSEMSNIVGKEKSVRKSSAKAGTPVPVNHYPSPVVDAVCPEISDEPRTVEMVFAITFQADKGFSLDIQDICQNGKPEKAFVSLIDHAVSAYLQKAGFKKL
jgi:ParB family chromosome partitioning protein